jgi:hypothetical protein
LIARPFNRDGGVPRSVLILTVLLLVAAGALFFSSQREPVLDYTLGGPLFPVDQSEIEGVLLTRQGAQYRLDRVTGDIWSLSGAVTDYVDSLAVLKLLENLTSAVGGPLLPGTDVEDRRYEFNGPEGIRLTVFRSGGEPITLAMGTANPVAGNFYASGAGRDACFMVPAVLGKMLGELPGSLQARKLLPGLNRKLVDRVDLRRGDRDFLVERRDGLWWMLMPAEGPAYLGREVRDYQAMYTDRRTTDERGDWVLVSNAAMDLQIYQASNIIVREILPPAESVHLLETLGLDPPWRQVTLTGKGINPDPNADSPDRMTIAFGPALSVDSAPVLRRGNVLVTEMEALEVLEQSLGILAHRTALTFLVLQGDTIELEREGRLLLRGERTGVAQTAEGRKAWLTVFPKSSAMVGNRGISETARNGLSQDVVVDLDRVPVLAVLPPTTDSAVLADRERVRITVTFGTGEEVRTEVIEFGFLVEDRLPAGSPPLVYPEDGSSPVGVWFPVSGKLLQVPAQTVVTARNLVQFAPQTK